MKQLFFITALLLAFDQPDFAQGNKSVFFELGGNGLFLSANFDSRFTKKENGFGFRAGIGFVPAFNGDGLIFPQTPAFLTIPIGVNHLLGRGPHYLESGLGFTYIYTSGTITYDFWGYSEDVSGSAIGFIPSIGYRYAQIGPGRFQGRIFVCPAIGSGGVVLFGGLSAGFKF